MAMKAKPTATLEDYLRLPEGVRAELIDGEILMTPAANRNHQNAILTLAATLRQHVRSRGLGEVMLSPFSVFLPSGSVVEPDVIFIAKPHLSILRDDGVHGAPDLLIEVVSPSHPERDRFVKRGLYARNGVPEFWMVDPGARAVEVFRLAGNVYEPAGYFTTGRTLTSLSIPGLAIPAAEIFA